MIFNNRIISTILGFTFGGMSGGMLSFFSPSILEYLKGIKNKQTSKLLAAQLLMSIVFYKITSIPKKEILNFFETKIPPPILKKIDVEYLFNSKNEAIILLQEANKFNHSIKLQAFTSLVNELDNKWTNKDYKSLFLIADALNLSKENLDSIPYFKVRFSLAEYFKILKTPVNSDIETITKNYRKLILKFHPDKNPSAAATEKYMAIKKAYEMIILHHRF